MLVCYDWIYPDKPADNVAVALHPLSKGTIIEVNGNFIELAEDIPAGHKIAFEGFAEGDYGE